MHGRTLDQVSRFFGGGSSDSGAIEPKAEMTPFSATAGIVRDAGIAASPKGIAMPGQAVVHSSVQQPMSS